MTEATKNLSAAVAAVMAGVHRVKKDDTNKHGGYKFVSVDDIKDSLRPLLAANGLEVALTEIDYAIVPVESRNGITTSAQFTFELHLRHTSGESTKPERTTVLLPHTGAQTTGAAKSYALKEWLKTRFLVSTGEKDLIEGGADADAFAPQDYSAEKKPPTYDRNPIVRAAFMEVYQELLKIGEMGTLEDVASFWKAKASIIKALPADWLAELTEKKDEIKANLQQRAA